MQKFGDVNIIYKYRSSLQIKLTSIALLGNLGYKYQFTNIAFLSAAVTEALVNATELPS